MSDSLKYQIQALKIKLNDIPKMIDGKYNRKYFALKAKITNLENSLCICEQRTSDECLKYCIKLKQSWNEFLSK